MNTEQRSPRSYWSLTDDIARTNIPILPQISSPPSPGHWGEREGGNFYSALVAWFIDLFIKAVFVLSAITIHHQTQLRFCEATLYFSPAVISCKSSGGFAIRLLWLPVFSKCLSADFIPENPRYQLKGKSNLFTPLLCTGNDNLLYWKVKRENKTVPEFHIIWPGPTCILQVFIPARLIVIIGSSQIPEIITLYCGGKIRLQVLWISACQNIT